MAEQNASAIVDKAWWLFAVLRDDGVSYGDYLEQLTYLIFIKMADEYSKPLFNRNLGVPAEYSWGKLAPLAGAELEEQYKETLKKLGEVAGTLAICFYPLHNLNKLI